MQAFKNAKYKAQLIDLAKDKGESNDKAVNFFHAMSARCNRLKYLVTQMRNKPVNSVEIKDEIELQSEILKESTKVFPTTLTEFHTLTKKISYEGYIDGP